MEKTSEEIIAELRQKLAEAEARATVAEEKLKAKEDAYLRIISQLYASQQTQ